MEEKIVRDGLFKVCSDGTIYKRKNGNWEQANVYTFIPNKNRGAKSKYKVVSAMYKGKQTQYYVHRLMAEAFVSNPKNVNVVVHLDGDSLNNDPSNLKWVTPKERAQLSVALGRGRKLEDIGTPCIQCGSLTANKDEVCPKCKQEYKIYLDNIERLENIKEEFKNVDKDKLNDREKIIVEMRIQGKTLQEIGDKLGIVRERVRQLLERIKIKHNSQLKINEILKDRVLKPQDIEMVRNMLGINQYKMSKALSISPSTYKEREANPLNFTIKQMRKISAIFGREIDIYEGD